MKEYKVRIRIKDSIVEITVKAKTVNEAILVAENFCTYAVITSVEDINV